MIVFLIANYPGDKIIIGENLDSILVCVNKGTFKINYTISLVISQTQLSPILEQLPYEIWR